MFCCNYVLPTTPQVGQRKREKRGFSITYDINPIQRNTYRRISNNRKIPPRIVSKTGLFNIEKFKQQQYRILSEFVNAFIQARWRFTLVYCFLTNLLTWLIFGEIWWLIVYTHGDLQEENTPDLINTTIWTPCIKNIYGFASAFLFSIEVQTTIGYGKRSLTLECPSAMFVMCMQSIVGTIIQSFIVGILFAKLTRPKNRAQTISFSKSAVINQMDGNLCLVFRVGDIRKSRLIAVSVQAYLLKGHRSRNCNYEQIKLEVSVDACDDIVFMFPLAVVHKIDRKSPLYSFSAEDLWQSKVEILVVLEGIIESTGQPVQVRSSYTEREILWGHRFVEMVTFRSDLQGFEIDFSYFDQTVQIESPLTSARNLAECKNKSVTYTKKVIKTKILK